MLPSGRTITTRSSAIFWILPPPTVSPTEYPATRLAAGSSRNARLLPPAITTPWRMGLARAMAGAVAVSLRPGLKRLRAGIIA
jgi:hypothetical protein